MSRTFRRKDTKHAKFAITESDNYHRDSWYSMNHAPKWYRTILNRKLRNAQNMKVKTMKYNEHIAQFDNTVLPIFVKDDSWFW